MANKNSRNGAMFLVIPATALGVLVVVFLAGGARYTMTLLGIFAFVALICFMRLSTDSAAENGKLANKATFKPTKELEALLRRQSMEDKLRYLGTRSYQDIYDKYPNCITQQEFNSYFAEPCYFANNTEANEGYEDDYVSDNQENNKINWGSPYKPIRYPEDGSYENFYMQREDEYKLEYGDDYEDAIDEAWDEYRRDKKQSM